MAEVQRSYTLSAEVRFEYDPEKVDPFYYIEDGQRVWRMQGIYSDITTESQMWEHLAFNAMVNGVTDASRLDGWADLEKGELTIRVLLGEAHIEENT